jgi:hypothetical protein
VQLHPSTTFPDTFRALFVQFDAFVHFSQQFG